MGATRRRIATQQESCCCSRNVHLEVLWCAIWYKVFETMSDRNCTKCWACRFQCGLMLISLIPASWPKAVSEGQHMDIMHANHMVP